MSKTGKEKTFMFPIGFFLCFYLFGRFPLVPDLVWEGGALVSFLFDLDLSVSDCIGGTWEELLSESFSDKLTVTQ